MNPGDTLTPDSDCAKTQIKGHLRRHVQLVSALLTAATQSAMDWQVKINQSIIEMIELTCLLCKINTQHSRKMISSKVVFQK